MIVPRSLRFCVLSLPKKCSLNVEKSFNALRTLRGTLVLAALAVLVVLAVLATKVVSIVSGWEGCQRARDGKEVRKVLLRFACPSGSRSVASTSWLLRFANRTPAWRPTHAAKLPRALRGSMSVDGCGKDNAEC